MIKRVLLPMLAMLVGPVLVGCAEGPPANTPGEAARSPSAALHESTAQAWPRYTLGAERTWQLNLPGGQEFDASGLVITKTGEMLTINDRGATVYRIQFLANT